MNPKVIGSYTFKSSSIHLFSQITPTWHFGDPRFQFVDGAFQHTAPSVESLEKLRLLLVDNVFDVRRILSHPREGITLKGENVIFDLVKCDV